MSHKRKYSISTSQMIAGIRKLQLQPGDLLVVSSPETIHYLEALGRVVNFTVPIVFAPTGIQKLNRQDLLNLLEQLDSPQTLPSNLEHPTAPV